MRIIEFLLCATCFLVFTGSGTAIAQDSYESDNNTEAVDPDLVREYYQNHDSTAVVSRAFNAQELERLRQDPELTYRYTQGSTSLWDAFWLWVSYQLSKLFQNSGGSGDWDQLILFVLFASALVYVITRLLKVNTFRILYRNKERKPIEAIVEHENIHEMDFEKLLGEATEAKDYRLAVRLCYLWSLKMLADSDHLHWEPGKTNRDYLRDLRASPLSAGFRQLSYYFEYAWYGNFSVTPELFNRVNGIFSEWKTRI